MNNKKTVDIKQPLKKEFGAKSAAENSADRTRTFDDLYQGKCYVVKEGSDAYKLKHLPKASPKEATKHFHTGDRVKNQYGRVLTVLVQLEHLVIVKEETNNYHPRDLTIIERAVDTYQV